VELSATQVVLIASLSPRTLQLRDRARQLGHEIARLQQRLRDNGDERDEGEDDGTRE
jgi:hypothetical protein